ncbi:MAG TPA: hypothetical protein VJS89_08320 [Gammaproteobacteria bacterium]|nr:hypothetical protein [Gammaproteobacteria bacterium]
MHNYGNDLTETRSYDQAYRLTSISVPGVAEWTLTDNADDDITGVMDNLNSRNDQNGLSEVIVKPRTAASRS